MSSRLPALLGIAMLANVLSVGVAHAQVNNGPSIERGRYLARTAGCNDCHTPGYMETAGKVPEREWLVGSKLGWRGPWGTTYPANLRQVLATMTEEQWVRRAKTTELRPPMPWFALRDMTEQDLASIYRFVRYLGPAGEPAPAFLPPGQQPQGPHVQFPG